MDAPVPIIFTPPVQRQTVGPWARLLALAIALGALTVLLVAASVTPALQGMGTHLGLGFRRCDFLVTTGLPCPSCGMTTSFAWFVRGNWLASFYVQPMGFLLALLCGGLFWAALYVSITGGPLHRLLREVRGVVAVMAVLGMGIAAWAWKIFIHLRGIDGWG